MSRLRNYLVWGSDGNTLPPATFVDHVRARDAAACYAIDTWRRRRSGTFTVYTARLESPGRYAAARTFAVTRLGARTLRIVERRSRAKAAA